MTDREPQPIDRELEDALINALYPVFGENLNLFFDEQLRHDKALRDISERFTSGVQLAFTRAFNRALTDGNLEQGFAVHAQIEDYRGGQDAEIKAARDAEIELHRKNVEALKVKR